MTLSHIDLRECRLDHGLSYVGMMEAGVHGRRSGECVAILGTKGSDVLIYRRGLSRIIFRHHYEYTRTMIAFVHAAQGHYARQRLAMLSLINTSIQLKDLCSSLQPDM